MNFLRKLFSNKKSDTVEARPDPCRPLATVNIVGDIHGCLTLAQDLFDRIGTSERIVTVGDYVDRGPKSCEVLIWLHALQTREPERIVCLKGNHEVMMLDFLDHPIERGPRWLTFGGMQTLQSFGVTGVTEIMDPDQLTATRDALKSKMPEGLEDWIRRLPTSWNSGNLWVVHAAADPVLPMTEQQEKTLLWGHSSFLRQPRTDGDWVAHGHTVITPPEQKRSRISTDTGAYHTGLLTAAKCLTNGEVMFLQARDREV